MAIARPAARLWRWFRGLGAEWLANGIWLGVSASVTILMALDLGRAAVLSEGVPPWLLRDRGAAYFAGSFVLGLGAAAWYVVRSIRARRPWWETSAGASVLWAFSPGFVPAYLFAMAFVVLVELRRGGRLLFDGRFAERYHRYVGWVRAGREGVRGRPEPMDRPRGGTGLD
jgi:hypothetical protein